MNQSRASSFAFALAALAAMAAAAVSAAPAKPIQLPAETVKLKPSSLPGYVVAQQKCAMCHSADYIAYQPPGMTVAQWTAEMTKMQHLYGAPISDVEVKVLGVYLAATYGDANSVTAADRALTAEASAPMPDRPASTAAIDVQALLNANACLGCHAVAQKIVGPAYHDVANKYKADPAGLSKIAASIKGGSSGKWGTAPMPPFAQLTDTQIKELAAFVMKQ
ncbi:sulfite dehydrogenase (cytochrome) subunit SorB [Variovorax sp. HW608]|uniref:SorB family sulfite dehydrogenase c-type cytochrome subunit n=1 Tax=Variovorax sp. HW608 TaxID=1034889 RepID=UPI00081FB727|nr:c-type cytochrome [Variovorax sp. HW608]SCK18582.1 sulfite dehydrogenase (cytochrome) subunit SorB [Variovorax sp. HW608]